MAQTKRKRRSKHRGNAIGQIEARGRTGRKPTDSERGGSSTKTDAAARREAIRNRPPSWSSALKRSAVAAVAFVVLLAALFHRPLLASLLFGIVMLGVYTPMSYYLDSYIFRRRHKPGSV